MTVREISLMINVHNFDLVNAFDLVLLKRLSPNSASNIKQI